MKQQINGKMYDTLTARQVGRWNCVHEQEALYRKNTGEYFLCNGEKITPVTNEEGKEWAENRLSPGEYSHEFGEKDAVMTFTLPASRREELMRAAEENEVSPGTLLNWLIERI